MQGEGKAIEKIINGPMCPINELFRWILLKCPQKQAISHRTDKTRIKSDKTDKNKIDKIRKKLMQFRLGDLTHNSIILQIKFPASRASPRNK